MTLYWRGEDGDECWVLQWSTVSTLANQIPSKLPNLFKHISYCWERRVSLWITHLEILHISAYEKCQCLSANKALFWKCTSLWENSQKTVPKGSIVHLVSAKRPWNFLLTCPRNEYQEKQQHLLCSLTFNKMSIREHVQIDGMRAIYVVLLPIGLHLTQILFSVLFSLHFK